MDMALETKRVSFSPFVTSRVVSSNGQRKQASHQNMASLYHLRCVYLPSSCMNSVTAWGQGTLQVLFGYRCGM